MTTAPAYDNSVRIGYARVSTRAQEHQAQLDALAAGHCRKIIVETASTRGDCPKLRDAWTNCRPARLGFGVVSAARQMCRRGAPGVIAAAPYLGASGCMWLALVAPVVGRNR